jgi:hypothetical protein
MASRKWKESSKVGDGKKAENNYEGGRGKTRVERKEEKGVFDVVDCDD